MAIKKTGGCPRRQIVAAACDLTPDDLGYSTTTSQECR
jgi:hypothetical protein